MYFGGTDIQKTPASFAFMAGAMMTEAVMKGDEKAFDSIVESIAKNEHMFKSEKTEKVKTQPAIYRKAESSKAKDRSRTQKEFEDFER